MTLQSFTSLVLVLSSNFSFFPEAEDIYFFHFVGQVLYVVQDQEFGRLFIVNIDVDTLSTHYSYKRQISGPQLHNMKSKNFCVRQRGPTIVPETSPF